MKRSLIALLLCCLAVAIVRADNWPNWRGPGSNGVAQGDNYPTSWSKTENVLWQVKLPGKGASTPVVWGKQIFLTCGVEGQNTVVCLDRAGKTLWQTVVGQERAGKHKKATGSNPSAVTDGEHVFVYFKSGDLACLDFAGKVVWKQNLQQLYGEDTLWWDLGTSPVLTHSEVVVAVMQTGPSYLAAFDKATGQAVWKQDRNVEAPSEAAQSYSTPLVLQEAGREILVVLGADHVTGHDAATGKELWRVRRTQSHRTSILPLDRVAGRGRRHRGGSLCARRDPYGHPARRQRRCQQDPHALDQREAGGRRPHPGGEGRQALLAHRQGRAELPGLADRQRRSGPANWRRTATHSVRRRFWPAAKSI